MRAYKTMQSMNQMSNLEQYLPLVRKIASNILKHLPSSVELNDLIQNGILGLIDALKNYDPTHKNSFESYASQRIRGAILDELRREDPLPKDLRQKLKLIQHETHILEQKLGRQPQEQEISDTLGWTLQEYQNILGQAKGIRLISLEDLSEEHTELESIHEQSMYINPINLFENIELHEQLVELICCLSEREQLLMKLYYDEELNLKEIAYILGISESRVCQIHTQIILRLRQSIHSKD